MQLAIIIVAIVCSLFSLLFHYIAWMRLQSKQRLLKYRETAKEALERILNGSDTFENVNEFQIAITLKTLTPPEIERGILAIARNASMHHQKPKIISTNPNCKFLSSCHQLHCAVNPTAETCDGCKDFEPKE